MTERPIYTKQVIIRQLEATVLLSMDDAERFGLWLLEGVQRN